MFLISLGGKESIFEQIRDQIIKFISAGVLKPGDRLPSVRSLASDLGVNPNTVMKAYQELESNGYIYTVNKKGVFVADNDIGTLLHEDAAFFLRKLKEKGVRKETLVKIVNEIYGENDAC